MDGRSRPTARMRLSGESVKVEKHENAVMFAGEHDGVWIGAGMLFLVTPAEAGMTSDGNVLRLYFGDSTISIWRPSMRG